MLNYFLLTPQIEAIQKFTEDQHKTQNLIHLVLKFFIYSVVFLLCNLCALIVHIQTILKNFTNRSRPKCKAWVSEKYIQIHGIFREGDLGNLNNNMSLVNVGKQGMVSWSAAQSRLMNNYPSHWRGKWQLTYLNLLLT